MGEGVEVQPDKKFNKLTKNSIYLFNLLCHASVRPKSILQYLTMK